MCIRDRYQRRVHGLAKEIATHLDVQLGRIETYTSKKNAELKIKILDSLSGGHAYVIQSLCPPINDNLMELCLIISALKRADAASVTAIIPYFAYSRHAGNDSKSVLKINDKQCLTNFLSCADVANMIELSGCDKIITVNFHNTEIRGFFKIPLLNIDVSRLCAEYMKNKKLSNLLVISTDCKKMWVQRAFTILGHLQTIGVINRNQVRFGSLIPQKKSPPDNYMYVGPEIDNSDCLVIDSLVDTGITLTSASQLLYNQGAKRIFFYATHGLLTHDAWKQVQNSKVTELILTDTIPTYRICLLYTSPSPRDRQKSRMPSSA
eukprot:TRINITY_DN759_c0_g1_i2.p1 TRINITY_DN759_c0_g1~~TRINITY_DN759_c0_g1_i2.p1  ORF type:complete len:321 (+),score=44.51 TRINITY_DN759_c0_g1_i2:2-964(+)